MPQLAARHLLFVYGTLKRGYTNWQRYLGVAESHQAAHYLGSAVTLDAFPMVVRPADWPGSSTRAPVLSTAGTKPGGRADEATMSTL